MGEPLAEEIRQQPAPPAQHRKRRVVAHRADRLLAFFRHRPDDQIDFFRRVTKRALLEDTVDELQQGGEGGAAGADRLRKRAFVLAELRLANESLLYGSGSERDLRLAQALKEQVAALAPAEAKPYAARCVAGAAGQADALRRDVGPTARNLVVEHFLAQRLPPPPTASAGPVALPPGPSTGGQDAWFPSEPGQPAASAPVGAD